MIKKLLIFIPSLAGGGAERTVVNIINHINKEIFNVVLVMVNEHVKNDNRHEYFDLVSEKAKIRYLNCPLSIYSTPKIIKRLAHVISVEKPDLIFSTTIKANLIAVLAKKVSKLNVPIIVRESNNRTESGVSVFYRKITSILYNEANQIIALSQGVAKDLVENFNVKEEKLTVIYNPVDLDNINVLKDEVVDMKDICNTDERLIISVGRLVKQKDFETLLKAFALIEKKVKSRLLILGKGPEEEHLRSLAGSLNISDKVIFLGFVKNPYKYIKNADIFILSSRWEGFGHVIVESMAAGTPVIATNCKSGPSEIILDNQFGKLVPVGDFIAISEQAISLLENKDKLLELKQAGLHRATSFNAQDIVGEYEKIILNVMDSK